MSLPDKNDLVTTATQQQSFHVNDGDKPAEFVDRRNQIGQPFDENVNEFTTGHEIPQSAEITEKNRYATADNAQKRVINSDGSIPTTGSE